MSKQPVDLNSLTPEEADADLEARLTEPISPTVFDEDKPPIDEDVQYTVEIDEAAIFAEVIDE